MGFSTALSGLNAASKNLQVTSNNIANANTTGFKKSRAEFSDVYATSAGGGSGTTPGAGVTVASVAQQFNQGSLGFTDNNLDLAISGEGFFTLARSTVDTENRIYTRSGEFKLDKDGNVVNNLNYPLLVYKPNGKTVEEGFSQGILQPLQINSTQGLPTPTTDVLEQVNLEATQPDLTSTVFDPTNSTTFTRQTSVSVFDTLGKSHTLTSYFVAGPVVAATAPATGSNREWNVFHYMDGNQVNVSAPISPVTGTGGVVGEKMIFDSLGLLIQPVPPSGVKGEVKLASYTIPASSAEPLTIKFSYANSTQIASPFSVDAQGQNGLPAGRLTGIDVNDKGIVFARFSNGGSTPLGQVALTRFSNPQGLAKLGDTLWAESINSGESIPGEGGGNNFGLVKSGTLEGSNVDLSAQLVNLIIAQQAYQANAQSISTENTITQTILNIR